MDMTKQKDQQIVEQIRNLLGGDPRDKSVTHRIEVEIQSIKDDFNNGCENGDYEELAESTGLDYEKLMFDSKIDRYELFSRYQDNNPYLYLDEIETFIENVDDWERDLNRAHREVAKLKRLLKD